MELEDFFDLLTYIENEFAMVIYWSDLDNVDKTNYQWFDLNKKSLERALSVVGNRRIKRLHLDMDAGIEVYCV